MEFTQLTERNAKNHIGRQLIFKLKDKPILSTLLGALNGKFVIEINGTRRVLSSTHPVFVIVDKSSNNNPSASLHYSMNFLQASSYNVLQFVGHYVLVRSDGGKVSINKIRSVSKSLYYISVKSGITEKSVDLRGSHCYIVV